MANAPKPHWLSIAGKTSTPSVVVSFDTETKEVDAGDRTVQTLRCWNARTRLRHDIQPSHPRTRDEAGEHPAALADVAEYAATLDKEAWIVAHNIGFDLAVTSLPFILVDRGWHIDGVHLGDESCFWILKKPGQKLLLTDSWSWVRCDLATAGKDIGKRKVPLPSDSDALAQWHKRCKRDVDILDGVMLTIMDWWDSQPLGKFGITGAGCGWSAMRSMIPKSRILVGPIEPRTSFERSAIHGGRKQVWQVGQFAGEWFADYDFVSAYPTTVAAFPMPEVARKWYDELPYRYVFNPPTNIDVIAEVEITTQRPCAPCKIDGEVWWPTGTFRTTLTGPEIRYAATIADEVIVFGGHTYRMGFALATWAGWCLALQSARSDQVPPIIRRIAKGWGRSVIGRFASRTSRVTDERPAVHLGWHLETGHDVTTGAAIEVLSIGGQEMTFVKDVDGTDCSPAVLAFVEGYCRVALAQMLDSREPSRLLQCNTDGWWERRAVRSNAYVVEDVPKPYTVIRKALERQMVVLGPNHVETPHERRFAGIPRKADNDGKGTFTWHDWPGFRWQLEHGTVGEYHRPLRDAVLQDHYVRSWVLTNGETVPATAGVNENGATAILAWSQTIGRVTTDVLSIAQVARLKDLMDTPPIILQAEVWPGKRQAGRHVRTSRVVGRSKFRITH